jgi:cbb3-type cytochrome oxidase subunit 3
MNMVQHGVDWVRLNWIVVMLGVFALIVVVTYWPGRRASFQHDASIPMNDDI